MSEGRGSMMYVYIVFLQVLVLSFSLFFIPKFVPDNMGTGLGSTASVATGAVAAVGCECWVKWLSSVLGKMAATSDARCFCLPLPLPVRSRSLLDTPTDEYGYVQEEVWPADAEEGVEGAPPPGAYRPHAHFTEDDTTVPQDTDYDSPRHVEDL